MKNANTLIALILSVLLLFTVQIHTPSIQSASVLTIVIWINSTTPIYINPNPPVVFTSSLVIVW